ncbi:MAG TPA: hypothetical protein VGS19_33175 [Streptosporangiaceae bacterium]|nr:hypothetical protein [Streptosporangiaceae bacterium]
MPDIDFARIRPHGRPASRSGGFEELSSILIEQGVVAWPDGVRFGRFGNPDGGREGRGVLPNGDVWAWQSKYLFEFNASAAAQVTESFLRALDTEPDMKRYLVAFPVDLPAGDTTGRTSAYTRWTGKVTEWEAAARAKGREVTITFVGEHDLLTALTEPRHVGRAQYWFSADVLTPEWQGHRVDEVIAKAGPRYSPRLHVEVDTVRAFDAVGRTEAYLRRWQEILAGLREARQWSWRAPAGAVDTLSEALSRCDAAIDAADDNLEQVIAAIQSNGEPPSADAPLEAALEAVDHVDALLHEHHLEDGRYFVGDAGGLYEAARKARVALMDGERLARSETTRAAARKRLLLTGRAGVGKTHLLCDLAQRRTNDGSPTILLLGQDFDGRSLLSQIGELSQLGETLDEVLAVLDAASEAAGCQGLFIIDALNESERHERWHDDLRALDTTASRYQHIAVVVSCRTEFLTSTTSDGLFPAIEHDGFGEETEEAVQRFAEEFGLEPPTFPVLNPEFSNPLFLKLTCDSLSTLGAARFPFGAAGIVTVCDAFLEAVNKRLSAPGRCDYDELSDPVSRATRELALLGSDPMDRTEVQRITGEALPDRVWSKSLMRGLISEGVLTELGDGKISFGYQRLADVTRAHTITADSVDSVRDWLQELGDDLWREPGLIEALAVTVPERHHMELLELALSDDGTVPYEIVDSFLESLLLRSPDSVTPQTAGIVERLLSDRDHAEQVWDRLVRVACIPGHPLNAEWLHTRLVAYEVADRDQSWSTWLIIAGIDPDERTAVRRLIRWAWPTDLGGRGAVPDEVAVLAVLVLGWFLSTTDRRVRDRATKAIVSIAERAPRAFATAVARFKGVNDPYVIERLAAAACGVVLRSSDPDAALLIADGVRELVIDGWPRHLMTRDYIRRVFALARAHGWQGPDGVPPYGADWPIPGRSFEEIEALAGPPDYAYGSIWHSLTGMGDFGRYVMGSALRDVASEDTKALRHDAERAVFDRALELGWTPDRFGERDKRLAGARDGVVERVGKKYQWIGFNEILGAITDHHPVKLAWGDTEPHPYEYAEQLVWRDIDPTVLARKPASAPERLWFSPAEARFPPTTTEEYPADMAGVPDPLALIAVNDPQQAPHLVLISHPSWQQPLPPEIEAQRPPRLTVWMQIQAYLVPVSQAPSLCEWAQGKDWQGRWMPEVAEPHNVLLGAHPDDPEWSAADGSIAHWDEHHGGPQPAELWQCAAWYGGTGTSRDASAEAETTGYVPSKRLHDTLGLSTGVDFTWRDTAGIATHDPSVILGGPGTLTMRRDLVPRLTDAGLTIFWTALIGNELHPGGIAMPPGPDYRWVNASASYILRNNRIEQVTSSATRCQPGPVAEHELHWEIRPGED